MNIDGLELALIILFNTAVCIMLPRLITLNWSEKFSQLSFQQKTNPESVSVQ